MKHERMEFANKEWSSTISMFYSSSWWNFEKAQQSQNPSPSSSELYCSDTDSILTQLDLQTPLPTILPVG